MSTASPGSARRATARSAPRHRVPGADRDGGGHLRGVAGAQHRGGVGGQQAALVADEAGGRVGRVQYVARREHGAQGGESGGQVGSRLFHAGILPARRSRTA
ncbi:hypothetical protein P3T37_006212 [Kitasatospora sp. MAA4]|uniref:hypothetical protein n=1 Tax=Kitasatospora sp. MAA4 TaxID=3035093 RepID=UPI002473C853|nr:hypothetical protein [Kitasatospora sp. MAA4]MDH6136781.1 hypothetical protein [Kitasatospora sp. MAA4]